MCLLFAEMCKNSIKKWHIKYRCCIKGKIEENIQTLPDSGTDPNTTNLNSARQQRVT